MIDDELAATLLDSSPDGLLLVAADGSIVEANWSASTIFGYSVAELVGMNVDSLVPHEHRKAHSDDRDSYVAAPVSRPMGNVLRLFGEHADGSVFPVEISLSPVSVDGTVSTIATVRDVTDRQEVLANVALLQDRERIARDLHDMVIQRLFAAGMSLQAVAGVAKPALVAERIQSVVGELDDTIQELRSAIFQLGQPILDRSLSAHVAELINERSRYLGFEPSLLIDGDIDDLPDHVVQQLTATLAEALSNVARHADASVAAVVIVRSGDGVELTVTDDGVGIASVSKHRGGISNMMWRAAELGGDCTVTPAAPGGTRLHWRIPV